MHPYADPIVSNRLRLRRRQGLAQYAVAVKAGVSPTVLGMIERYDYQPGPKVRQKIATALGVSEQAIWPTIDGEPHGDAA
jgi:transcriptional regulator with XRE-family HTH domain